MEAMPPRLHPMSLSDLLDTTFALYRANFALFVGVVAVLAIPENIITIFLSHTLTTSAATTASGTTSFNGGAVVGAGLLTVAVTLLFTTAITGAMARTVSARYLGQQMTVADAYLGMGSATLTALLVATVLYGLGVVIGLVLIVIPGIYLAIRWIFVSQSVVLEHKTVTEAFGRSSELTRGSWWRVLGIVVVLAVVIGLIQAIVGGIFGAILGIVGLGVLGAVVGAIASILVQPIQLAGYTLLYYDLRIRKEGFDLQQLATHMEPLTTT